MGNRSAIEKEADGGILAIAHMVCFPSWRSLLRGAHHEGNAIKLSGRTFLAPHRGEARRYVANDFLNLIALITRDPLTATKKLPFRGVFLQRRDQNTVLTEPPYFFSMKSLTSLLVSAFMSFWSSGRFSSPSRTATIFAYGESEPSL